MLKVNSDVIYIEANTYTSAVCQHMDVKLGIVYGTHMDLFDTQVGIRHITTNSISGTLEYGFEVTDIKKFQHAMLLHSFPYKTQPSTRTKPPFSK